MEIVPRERRIEALLDQRFEWTPRQREVLDLIARSHSNQEIADSLGVSLDGAKWHMREILSKLNVDTREEAAEYWRRHNGIAPRFARLLRSVAGAGAGKWVAAGLVGVAVVGMAAVALALALNGGHDDPAASDTEPTLTATTAISTTSAPTAAGTVAPAAVRELTTGMRGLVGYDTVAYFGVTCYACGGELNLWRVYTLSGRLYREELLPGSSGYPAGAFYSLAAAVGRGEFLVAVCTSEPGSCGQEGVDPESENVLLHSTDGGVTWVSAGSLPLGSTLVGFHADEVVVRTFLGGGAYRHWYLGSGQDLVAPTTALDAFPFITPNGHLFWRSHNGQKLFDERGTPLDIALPADASEPFLVELDAADYAWVRWQTAAGTAFGRFEADASGTLVLEEGVQWVSNTAFQPSGVISRNLAYAGVLYEDEPCLLLGCPNTDPRRPAYEAALVRLDTATVHPIPELSEPLSGNQHPFLAGVIANFPFVRVNAPDGCIALRSGASQTAAALACIPDGVLARKGRDGPPVSAEGVTWAPIELPDGRTGWADQAFLGY
ncbi:MAG: helix-turn-helix transcriptional regulator [Dehalococcoidia bacterium]